MNAAGVAQAAVAVALAPSQMVLPSTAQAAQALRSAAAAPYAPPARSAQSAQSAPVPQQAQRREILLGFAAAALALLIYSTYTAVTRRGMLTSLSPDDMIFLRLGGSGLCLLPYLIHIARKIPADLWHRVLPLSFAHGWGMVGFTIFGLQIAPAGHGSSLGPGMISVWIALFSWLAFCRTPTSAQRAGLVLIVAGGALILLVSASGMATPAALLGDLMFVAASMCGASYLVYAEHRRIPAGIGTALVAVTSAVIVVPWYFLFAVKQIPLAPVTQVFAHFLIQGVLMGCVAFMAVGYALLRIGSLSVGMMLALVPVAGMLSSIEISGDSVSPLEWFAVLLVTAGVAAGVMTKAKAASPAGQVAPGGPKPRTRGAGRVTDGTDGGCRSHRYQRSGRFWSST